MPKFSIIIPVYNVAPYLRECLDSVLAQTFTDWEAICVDDGSTDESGAILDEYAARDARFKVFHKENGGVGAARNVALDAAKGGWFCFLDADDVWNCYLLQTIYGAIENHPKDVLFRFGIKKFAGDLRWDEWVSQQECTFKVIDISKEISIHDFADYLFWCYVYHRDLTIGIRFPRYIRGEDRCFLNKIQLERAQRIVATEVPFYGYRMRVGSAMNSLPSRKVLCDEMDHRLDLIRMIDDSGKMVHYQNASWAISYFFSFPKMVSYRVDSILLYRDWLVRIKKLSNAKLIEQEDREKLLRLNRFPFKYYYIVNFLCTFPFIIGRKFYRYVMKHGEFASL